MRIVEFPVNEKGDMSIGLYPEMRWQPRQTRKQVFGGILEQIVNANRLGDDLSAVSEHRFFKRFGVSVAPPAFFAVATGAREPRTRR